MVKNIHINIDNVSTLRSWLEDIEQRNKRHHEVNMLAITQFATKVGSIPVSPEEATSKLEGMEMKVWSK